MNIVVIIHDAGRTGAPIVALRLLRWLRTHAEVRFRVVVRRSGVLVADFQELGPTHVWDEDRDRRIEELLKRPGAVGGWSAYRSWDGFRMRRLLRGADLVYSNTLTNGRLLERMAPLDVPVVTHVHELDHWVMTRIAPAALRHVLDTTERFMVPSNAVHEMLVERTRIPPARVHLVRECIDRAEFAGVDVASGRATLQVDDDELVVGASGTLDLRKGADLFVQIADRWRRHRLGDPAKPKLQFRWVGGEIGSHEHLAFERDARELDLAEILHFMGETDRPLATFGNFDVLVLPSREDPYPLVVLEAAALGVPTICFEGAGGAPEFVRDDAGVVVPYLDLDAVVTALDDLTANEEERRRLGQIAEVRSLEEHDVTEVGPRFRHVLSSALRGRH